MIATACLMSLAAVAAAQSGGICTHVEGEVADTAVRVIRVNRVDKNCSYIYTDTISFANGRFSYDIHTPDTTVYWICAFNKDWIGRAVDFFADGDTVRVKFVPNASPVWSSPSPLNKELQRVNGVADSIYRYYEARYARFADYEHLTEAERRECDALNDSVNGLVKAFKLGYIRNNPGQVGFFLLFDMAERFYEDSVITRKLMAIYDEVYAERYPGFHLAEYMKAWRASRGMKEGAHYKDSSWCGPCRRLSRSIVPVYEKYKDRGFTVVGVARERDAEAMRKAIWRDKYPWLNLIELNDRAGLWNLYGIRGGGNKFLVDRDGTILAIDPKPEKLEAILKEKLK